MEMKHIGVLALLAVLLCSPMVIAESGNAENDDAGNDDASQVTANDTKVKTNTLTQLRDRIKERLANRLEIRADVAAARSQYQTERSDFLKLASESAGCKGDCDEIHTRLKVQAQSTLLSVADHVLSVLDRIRSSIESNENLDEAQKEKALGEIDETIAAVEDASDVVGELDEDSTKADIQAATKTIRNAWKDSRAELKKRAGQLAWGEMKAVVAASQRISLRLENTIKAQEKAGVDVSDLNDIKDDFDAKVKSANAHIAAAANAYAGITASNVDSKDNTVREEIKAAREDLKAAHEYLRKFMTQLREQAGKVSDDKDDSKDDSKESEDAADDSSDDADDSEDAADDSSDDADDSEDESEDDSPGNETEDAE